MLASLGDGSEAGERAALSAEVARLIGPAGDSGEAIFSETAAGPLVAIPLRAEGVTIGVLTLSGREQGYDARALVILGTAAAVMAAAIGGGREDRGGGIEAALRSITEVAGENVAPSSAPADGLRRELARLASAAGGEVRAEQVDLSAMAQEIAAELVADAPDRAARFDIAEGVSALADPRLLRLALEDLLGHAWAATAENERTEIAFGVREEGEDRVYFVRDNGPGFAAGTPDEDGVSLGRLYDDGALAGAEAALATVQRVVDRHGGRIRAHGRAGKGASFDFTLPAERGDGARAKPATWRMIPTKRR